MANAFTLFCLGFIGPQGMVTFALTPAIATLYRYVLLVGYLHTFNRLV
jgi:hypothetical protein